jgi:hypothetical protein
LRVLAFAGLTALLAACTFDKIAVEQTTSMVVVHAVLDPASTQQVMLLERTLTGAVTVNDSTFDPNDPIASAGGVPVSGATAEIIDTAGRAVSAVEDRIVTTGKGTGVYRFNFPNVPRLGARYQLHVHTAQGEDVTASTRIPLPDATSTGALTRSFNRDHDTLGVRWNRAQGARSYGLRVESPFGPFFIFTDSTSLNLPGDARNVFSANLERLFIPGFRQGVLVGAVDSNFFDYYRTQNDPFTGSGIISRVSGGIGLFGAFVTMTSGTLTVTADQTQPIEGRYRLSGVPSDPTAILTLNLFIAAKSGRVDVPDVLSGRYTTGQGRGDGLLGELSGTNVSIAILLNQLSGDTVDVFDGTWQGTTLTGTYRRSHNSAVFTKQ